MSKKYAGGTRAIQNKTLPSNVDTSLEIESSQLEPFFGGIGQPLVISHETQEQAKSLIRETFRSFAEHSQHLADELEEFAKRRDQMRNQIKNGVRRTSGRIV